MSDYKKWDERETITVMMMMMNNVRASVRKIEQRKEREKKKNIQSKIKFNKNLKGAHTTIDKSIVRNFNGSERAGCGQCFLGRTPRKNLDFLINRTQIPEIGDAKTSRF